MPKPVRLLILLCGTLLCSVCMVVTRPKEKVARVRFATVERGCVHQVIPMEGRMIYADMQSILATTSGVVTQVCARSDQRLASGEALLRLGGEAQTLLLSAMTSGVIPASSQERLRAAAPQAIRAERDCTVRQMLVSEGMMVTAGMPVAVVSSNRQMITGCLTASDAARVQPGMWAWVSANGGQRYTAVVETVGERQADDESGVLVAEVSLRPEQQINLPLGAVVDADIYLAGSDDVRTLPVEAVTERGTVWWVSEGRCTEIPAGVVLADELRAWVSLPEGITVAVGEFADGMCVAEADK